MALQIGNLRFAPGAIATVATILLLVGLVGLGRWQLARMHEKEVLFAAFAAGSGATLPLDSLTPASTVRYQHVVATGRYDSAHQILLDNMTHEGRAGFHVLTPLVSAGRTLLVDRGWVPLGPTREQLPDLSVMETDRTVEGRIGELPAAGIELTSPPAPADAPWPRVLSYPKLPELTAVLGRPLEPWVLLLDADQPDGYVREWRPATFPPERHLGYAITWFTLAATLVVIYIGVNLKREPSRQ